MQIRFWGTRGSVPAPGENTVEFGGNTSCVEVQLKSGKSVVMDAGTGIRMFGLDYLKRKDAPREIHLFLSHAHWDHIQGFPYFVPAFLSDFTLHIYSHLDAESVLSQQMSEPFFPVPFAALQSKKVYHKLGDDPVNIDGAVVHCTPLRHPQPVRGFRVQEGDAAVVYSTDTEHDESSTDENLIAFSKGANMLIYDAQYTPEEYDQGRTGWGHSTFEVGAHIAREAGIETLVLFHHEPTHDDEAVRAIEAQAKKLFPGTIAARERQTIELS